MLGPMGAGVPTRRTAFVPVDDALAAAIDSPAAVRRLLTDAIYGALYDAEIDPHDGVFVRGFYASAKSANVLRRNRAPRSDSRRGSVVAMRPEGSDEGRGP
jgi:hypothetical protein